jgi:outer membrane receptor protein involved in Fe transport
LNVKPKDYISLSFGLDNIFDEEYNRYVEVPNATGLYRMPGRAFKLGIALKK